MKFLQIKLDNCAMGMQGMPEETTGEVQES